MKIQELFPEATAEAIRRAVEEVERQAAAEVVPVVVGAAGTYPQAAWRGAALGALAAPLVVALLHRLVELWGVPWELQLLLPPALGAAVGFLLPSLFPPLARLLLFREELETQARERAEHAFLTEEVFATRERTGMLILVALFERQVVVLGDKGIAARIPQERWRAIADGVAQGIRKGKPGEALAWGIRQCGVLLQEAGIARKPGDVNELADQLRLEER